MRVSVMTVVLLVNLILQSTLFQYIKIGGIAPNTAVLIVVSYAILRGDIEGAIVGFFAGFLQDIFFGNYVGLYSFIYAMIGFMCGKPFKDFFRENYFIAVLLVLASMFSYSIIIYAFNFLLMGKIEFGYYLKYIILPETIYTTMLSLIIYRIIYGINGKIEAHEKRSQSLFK